MAEFSRKTLFEAYQVLLSRIRTHSEIDDLMYGLGLDRFADQVIGGLHKRLLQVFRYLKDNPDADHDGCPLIDLFVEEAIRRSTEYDEAFYRALKRDGFTVENGVLRRMLPEELDLPAAEDEVHSLLDKHKLDTTTGHLEQAIRVHSRGEWAAANSQFRTFLESLFDEIALRIDPVKAPASTGGARRQFLANLTPPFLRRDLNEWSDDGKNFVNGVFKKLHPQGSHPGPSDEEDSTFRLHLVVLTARLFLRRLDTTVGSAPRTS